MDFSPPECPNSGFLATRNPEWQISGRQKSRMTDFWPPEIPNGGFLAARMPNCRISRRARTVDGIPHKILWHADQIHFLTKS